MSDGFKHECRPRSIPRRIPPIVEDWVPAVQAPLGAGSGGDDADGGHTRYIDGAYKISANQINLWTYHSELDSAPLPYIVSIMGSDDAFTEGRVEMRGNKGVRITTGPPKAAGGPPMDGSSTNGVEVVVADPQMISLTQGVMGPKNYIKMGSKGISITANQGPVWVEAVTQIRLQVAGGSSYVEIDASGVTIKGPLIQIN